MTLSRPRATRLLRGSALGLGLLVAGGITAPAAFAIEEPTDGTSTDTPESAASSPVQLVQVPSEVAATMAPALSGNFGTGKDFTVQVRPYGPGPRGRGPLRRRIPGHPAGVRGRAQQPGRRPGGYTCTTDVDRLCSFHGPNEDAFPFPFPFIELPRLLTANRVDVDVPAGTYALTQVSASPGLAPATGSKTFTICDDDCGLPFGIRDRSATTRCSAGRWSPRSPTPRPASPSPAPATS